MSVAAYATAASRSSGIVAFTITSSSAYPILGPLHLILTRNRGGSLFSRRIERFRPTSLLRQDRTSEFINRFMEDSTYKPTVEWFSAFSVADGAIKALFDDATHKTFKALEILIGPNLSSNAHVGSTFAVYQFIEKRDAAIKAMYSFVLD